MPAWDRCLVRRRVPCCARLREIAVSVLKFGRQQFAVKVWVELYNDNQRRQRGRNDFAVRATQAHF